jgi:cytidine deaminase
MPPDEPSVEPSVELSDEESRLIAAAREARRHAYAPYSGFAVGAAVLAGGRVFSGANVENASYGLSVCAERNAMMAAVLDGARSLEAVAVASDASPPSAPCGMCRQMLHEFAADPAAVRVIMVNGAGERRETTLAELLPDAFGPKDVLK